MRTPAAAILIALMTGPIGAQEPEEMTLVQFSEPDEVRWSIVNDGVMGGRSQSDIVLADEGTALFSGTVSLDNNGGFASVRARFPSLDLSEFAGVSLRVRGDGRRYQLRLRTDGSLDGLAYRAEFDTREGEWTEVFLAFEDFEPSFRGYAPRGARPLDVGRIRQIGFLIGDKRTGPFSLEIGWVKALSDG